MARMIFEDTPSTNTPINATNLNKISEGTINVGTSVDDTYKTNILMGKNLLNKNNWTNAYYSSTGQYYTDNNNAVFEYIEVKPNTTYTFSTNSNVYALSINEFDSSKTWVKRNQNSNAKVNTVTVGSTTKYIRCVINKNDTTMTISKINDLTPQLEKGGVATTYEAYITPTINVDGEDIYVKGQNEVYSTNEQRIGTWIDGKPLYRKVVNFGALPNNSDKSVDLGINNLDLITSMRGITKRPGSNTMVIPTVSSGLSGMIVLYVDSSNKLHISTGEDRSNYTITYVTIEYTKTTD